MAIIQVRIRLSGCQHSRIFNYFCLQKSDKELTVIGEITLSFLFHMWKILCIFLHNKIQVEIMIFETLKMLLFMGSMTSHHRH